MPKFILTYLKIFVKKSFLAYFIAILFIYLLFRQTIALHIQYLGIFEVNNLWFYGSGGMNEYLMQLTLHSFIIFIFEILLLYNITSKFFSSANMANILTKKPHRKKIFFWYLLSVSIVITILSLIHFSILNVYLFNNTSELVFIESYKALSIIFLLNIYIVVVILFFSIITKNTFSGLTLTIIYVLVIPVLFGFAEVGTIQFPDFINNSLVRLKDYYVPSYISIYRDSLKHAFDMIEIPNWPGILSSITLFMLGSTYSIKRKVF